MLCFVLDQVTPGQWNYGGAGQWWLHQSLGVLQDNLKAAGGRLVLRKGVWAEQLLALADEVEAGAVYWSRMYEPYAAKAEQFLHGQLADKGIEVRRFGGYLLFEPEEVRTQQDEPYKVFTPFWKACLQRPEPRSPGGKPRKFDFYKGRLKSDSLKDWALLPTKPDWAGGFRESWKPGEKGAAAQLGKFIDAALIDYKEDRDIPALPGTSKLSPHLHFGEISPRQIWHRIQAVLAGNSRLQKGAESYLRELGWREFCYHLLHHWPDLPEQPFRQQFKAFPWRKDSKALRAWQQGQTGYPLIDAGMRQLWHTGWMHNRVRMIVASLLVKNLLVPWQHGEAWFWDTLVDADLANNAAGWQWVAGSGADAAPYFRIFNPVTQSEKFDPDGTYIKCWVPELAKLPARYIHAPWDAPESELMAAGVRLGKDYPLPIVDHKATRQRALDAYAKIKN